MKCIIFTAYYAPELFSSRYLLENMVDGLIDEGWDVEIFTPIPTRGVDEPIRRQYMSQKVDVINKRLKIHRIWLPREGRNVIQRFLRYLLMELIYLWKSFFLEGDVIFVASTPPIQGGMAAIVSTLKNIPFIYNLQDVFPDSLVSTGLTKENSTVWKIGRFIEKQTYKKAKAIITISRDMKENLLQKGVNEKKIFVIPNWVETDVIYPVNREENYLYDLYKLDRNKFYIVYAGNLGPSQNLEIILHVAKKLKNQCIRFLIFGSGNQELELKKMAIDMSLTNVQFFPLLPYSQVRYVYGLGDLDVVICKSGTGRGALPSKTWTIMSCGKPILASFDLDSMLNTIVINSGSGIMVEPSNVESLVNAIENIFQHRDKLEIMGKCGRQYIIDNLSRQNGVANYVEIFQKLKYKNIREK